MHFSPPTARIHQLLVTTKVALKEQPVHLIRKLKIKKNDPVIFCHMIVLSVDTNRRI